MLKLFQVGFLKIEPKDEVEEQPAVRYVSENEKSYEFSIPKETQNDILLARNNLGYVKTVKSWLNKSFHMKDLGEIDYILGVNIQTTRFEKFWSLSQETDTQKILKRFRMYYYKPMDNPIAR
uniref:Reverse transcriptase Ty1/copia-type domain-containing protein n=1 Tax=Solanum lycopersicum TaxID=4081 RepID=A0A3Q7HNE3_SOLLC